MDVDWMANQWWNTDDNGNVGHSSVMMESKRHSRQIDREGRTSGDEKEYEDEDEDKDKDKDKEDEDEDMWLPAFQAHKRPRESEG